MANQRGIGENVPKEARTACWFGLEWQLGGCSATTAVRCQRWAGMMAARVLWRWVVMAALTWSSSGGKSGSCLRPVKQLGAEAKEEEKGKFSWRLELRSLRFSQFRVEGGVLELQRGGG